MYEQFIDRAMSEVWCNPTMDKASIFLPKRISPPVGLRTMFRFRWGNLPMPNLEDRFHLYQIGHIPASFYGILTSIRSWTCATDVANANDLTLNFYVQDGTEILKGHVFFVKDKWGTGFIAVRDYHGSPTLRYEELYVHFYANSFRESDRSSPHDSLIYTRGGLLDTRDTVLGYVNEYLTRKDEGIGYVSALYNGIYHGRLIAQQLVVGNSLEITHDKSVKRVVDLPLDGLPTFDSALDGKSKYILHPPKSDDATINYYDDIDIYLIDTSHGTDGHFKGLRYHTNAPDAIRMLTHQDYAIPVSYVQEYLTDHPDVLVSTQTTLVRLVIKESGYERPLTFNAGKVHELYRLTDVEILQALTGLGSTIESWQAATLEQAMHNQLYGKMSRFSIEEVLEGYGYDASMKVLFDSPLNSVEDGDTEFHLPYGLQTTSTVYEYDTEGRLLGFYNHGSGTEYYPRSNQCHRIECFRGHTGTELNVTKNQTIVPLTPGLDHRFYLLTAVEPSDVEGAWIEAALDEHYRIEEGIVRWDVDLIQKTPLIYSDQIALGYEISLPSNDGSLIHQIVRNAVVDGVSTSVPLEISLGKLDVWLNGHPLIQELDFVVTQGQKLAVFNKEYRTDAEAQHLTIRWAGFHGHGYGDLQEYEVGFVNQGLLSLNNRYDVRDDRLMRIIIGGRLKMVEDLVMDENHTGVYVQDVYRDGTPYRIEYSKPPQWGLAPYVPENWREDALGFNDVLNNYMSEKLPSPEKPPFVSIDRHYTLFSTFIGAIVADILNDEIVVEHRQLRDEEVVQVAQPYLHLLPVDPCTITPPINPNLIKIHPHPYLEDVSVSLFEYTLLERLSHRYLNGIVDMTQYVTIGSRT